MKKIFIVTMLLMLLYISLRIGYKYYGNGHNYQYVITTENIDFTINESFTNNKDNSLYYIKIGYGADDFFIQTYYDFKNDSKIIENIYAFDDDKYKCILPVFKNSKIVMDIICKNNNKHLTSAYNSDILLLALNKIEC